LQTKALYKHKPNCSFMKPGITEDFIFEVFTEKDLNNAACEDEMISIREMADVDKRKAQESKSLYEKAGMNVCKDMSLEPLFLNRRFFNTSGTFFRSMSDVFSRFFSKL
jgi:hypothetical protein